MRGDEERERAAAGPPTPPFRKRGLLAPLLGEGVKGAEAGEADARAPLFPEEEELVASAVEKRRREVAAGRSCARRALAEMGEVPVALPADPDRVPRWPEGIVGSIAHTEGYAAAAVARAERAGGVGLDAEWVARVTEEIEGLIARPEERRWIAAQGERAVRGWARALVFSAKEAAYKCQFPKTGERYDFLEAEIGLAEGSAAGAGQFWVRFERGPVTQSVPILWGRYVCQDDLVASLVLGPDAWSARSGRIGDPSE